MWGLENVSNKMDYLIKTFSVRVLKVLLGFFLLFIVKCKWEEDKLKDQLLTQKESRLVSLENCQPLKMGKKMLEQTNGF